MKEYPAPLDLTKVKVYPLRQRDSLSFIDRMVIDPKSPPKAVGPQIETSIQECVEKMRRARERNSSVILMYGAHLIKNGAMSLVSLLLDHGWVTHLATNGAGTIHDWELAFLGRTEESVRKNVATGSFGTWDETGQNIHLALLAGALRGEGYGRSLGRFIVEDGTTLPAKKALEESLREEPSHPLSPARAELLHMMVAYDLSEGRIEVKHPW